MAHLKIIYKTDNLHSYASRDVIGVSTTMGIAITICKQRAQKEGCEINPDQLFNLKNYNQTQGYSGEGEFHIETIKTNQLL